MPEPETQVLLRRQERKLRRLMADIAKSVEINKDIQARVGMQERMSNRARRAGLKSTA
jgi:hypothetical protein